MESRKSNPPVKPGDMIAFPRSTTGCRLFDHYGIADGEGNVIHFTPVGPVKPLTGTHWQQGTYKREPITQVGAAYSVKNHANKTPKSSEEILKDANSKVGTTKLYHIEKFNCETAASEMRFGTEMGSSTQVQNAVQGATQFGNNLFNEFGLH